MKSPNIAVVYSILTAMPSVTADVLVAASAFVLGYTSGLGIPCEELVSSPPDDHMLWASAIWGHLCDMWFYDDNDFLQALWDHQLNVFRYIMETHSLLKGFKVFPLPMVKSLADWLKTMQSHAQPGSKRHAVITRLWGVVHEDASTEVFTLVQMLNRGYYYMLFFYALFEETRGLVVDREYASLEEFIQVHLDLVG